MSRERRASVNSRHPWPLLLAFALASCSDTRSTATDPSDALIDTRPIDAISEVKDAADDVLDAEEADLFEVGPGTELGGFGDPCDGDDDCDSRYCIDTDGGRICTVHCDDDCPEGFACRLLENAGVDAVRLCVPAHDDLCDRCTNDTECGGVDNLCLDQINGLFCATRCDEIPCPEGYGCNLRPGPDGDVEICEPLDGYCNRIRLTRSLLLPGGRRGEEGPYRHSGYILILPHEITNSTFRVSGGFR